MPRKNRHRCVALVLGGYVNGYSIVKELHAQGIKEIAVFDPGRSVARWSNKIRYSANIDGSSEVLLREILNLKKLYDYIIVFPTDDLHLENLYFIYDHLKDFCYLPFNRDTIIASLDKAYQYQVCENIGIPYPQSILIKCVEDLSFGDAIKFPVLIKPTSRQDLKVKIFRTLYVENETDFLKEKDNLLRKIEDGFEFVLSEFIPGDDTNIYAYTCFRSNQGEILNEWAGKKLTQCPDNFGVFSSASNEAPNVISVQGRDLVHALNAYGVVEPEFKYDSRDGKYKLMEVNLRSMMWNRMGFASSVFLMETQYKYAIGEKVRRQIQDKNKKIHLVLMSHEISNLISRKGYWKNFKNNVFAGDERCWAIFEWGDLKPFFYSLIVLFKLGVVACFQRLNLR